MTIRGSPHTPAILPHRQCQCSIVRSRVSGHRGAAAALVQRSALLSDWERSSTARVIAPARPRKLAKVPFAELADGRLQGVVSSGSDIERVYVSSVAAGTYAYACSTNNNRPCGGARGSFCNHIRALIDEAVLQYGAERVARYLRVEVADGSRARRASAPR
jgi:hypothetical protein